MTAKDVADLLDVIANRAKGLRDLGLRRVELGGGVAFTLAEPEPADAGAGATPPDDEAPRDALEDPETFGIRGPEAPRRVPRRARSPLMEPGS